MYNVKLPKVEYDIVQMEGGLDLVTPTLALKPGVCRDSLNFEVSVTGGYTRIKGYERVDGRPAPSDAVPVRFGLTAVAGLSLGQTITGQTSGATMVIVDISGLVVVGTKSSGTFTSGEVVKVGATTIGNVDFNVPAPSSGELARMSFLAAELYRADIQRVPGAGPVRGVAFFNQKVYAWRNNVGNTALVMYVSSLTGWQAVSLGHEIYFTLGLPAGIVEGTTVTGLTSGATGVIGRVIVDSGDFSTSDAAGRLALTSKTGTFMTGENLRVAGTNRATAVGPSTVVTLQPGGMVRTYEGNFGGINNMQKLYGADGVNRGFEFDGTVYTPISTGMLLDAPEHVVIHKQHLFFSFKSSVQFSSIGDPYNWSPILGAGELSALGLVTGFLKMPSSQDSGSLLISSLRSVEVLYGSDADTWELSPYNDSMGASAGTFARLEQAYALDERGVIQVAQSQNFGNFDAATLTYNVRSFVRERRNRAVGALVNREKSQYRVLYNDGFALYCTIVNGKYMGGMPIFLGGVLPSCVCQGETPDATETAFFGAEDGFVYRLGAGTSFDGRSIPFSLLTNNNVTGSPRIKKRYRKASIEVTGNNFAEFSFGYELGYSSPQLEQGAQRSYQTPFQSVYWDSFTWDAFVWDGRTLAPLEAEVKGTAENIAFRITGDSALIDEFTINSVVLHFTPRRGLR